MSEALHGSEGFRALMAGRNMTAAEVCHVIRPMLVPGFRARITINIDGDQLLPQHVTVEVRSPQPAKKDKM